MGGVRVFELRILSPYRAYAAIPFLQNSPSGASRHLCGDFCAFERFPAR